MESIYKIVKSFSNGDYLFSRSLQFTKQIDYKLFKRFPIFLFSDVQSYDFLNNSNNKTDSVARRFVAEAFSRHETSLKELQSELIRVCGKLVLQGSAQLETIRRYPKVEYGYFQLSSSQVEDWISYLKTLPSIKEFDEAEVNERFDRL